jgi:serine/threonine-protein kinase
VVDLIKGKYRLVREIARSNDIVYEAQDTALGRRIALKELNIAPNLTGTARRERIDRFNREARAAGRLSHPNIVSIYEFGEENGRHFIAMEFLEGQTLRDILQVRGALSLKESIDIACQTLEALGYAHANRVIHRDIKPDNIHILPGGQVKLADFGIARLTEEPSLTSDGQVFGTPSYMSPEQIEGRGIDYRSDLFSLGVLLYEMLSGRKPFTGDSVVSITYAVMHADPPPLNGVPMGVEQVIRRALSKSPAQRQSSAEQMRQDLRNAEQTPPLFFPSTGMNSTTMGQNGMGAYAGTAPSYPPIGNPAMGPQMGGMSGGYGGNANYGMGVPGAYAPLPQPTPPPQQTGAPGANGLPWSWNTSGSTVPPMMGQHPSLPAGMQGGPLTGAGGIVPYASPPYPAQPSEPLFTLSPGARTTLLSILGALVLGTALALGVVGFQRKYQDFQTNVLAQEVARLVAQANAAYNAKDYPTAANLLEQALKAKPDERQRALIQTELGYTYVLLARAAKDRNNPTEARDDYRKAITYSPDYDVAHTELSILLESMGDHSGAQEQQALVGGDGQSKSVPATLDNNTAAIGASTSSASGSSGNGGTAEDPNQFIRDQHAKAQQLLKEGDDLARQGQQTEAEDKWREALQPAAGTPIFNDLQQRLNNGQAPVDFGGGSN